MMKSPISVTKLKGCKLLNCNLDKDVDYQNENCGASAGDQKLLANVSTKDHVNVYVSFASAHASRSDSLNFGDIIKFRATGAISTSWGSLNDDNAKSQPLRGSRGAGC